MYETIKGMQSSGVQACAKHFILNEQERNRETMSSVCNLSSTVGCKSSVKDVGGLPGKSFALLLQSIVFVLNEGLGADMN